MNALRRISLGIQALRELGPARVSQYALYRLGLRLGWFRLLTPPLKERARVSPSAFPSSPAFYTGFLPLPDRAEVTKALAGQAPALLAEAGEIAAGRVRLFGAGPVLLRLDAAGPLEHWTAYERGIAQPGGRGETPSEPADIKFIWEPARFGWAYVLARAYHLSGEGGCAAAFWGYAEEFFAANPPNLGPHWSSAQEVALRLIALAFAGRVFANAPESTPERMKRLAQAIADHAARIPPTLIYARAQANNHLLSEAAGLYTAGVVLPDHPQAARWRAVGWRWFNLALQEQIDPGGAYIQHSANYHRLMLQLALWVQALAANQGQDYPPETRARLATAARWLLALADPQEGRLPNLGPNDGASIQPLAACSFDDYRPALQAAARGFLGGAAFSNGPWDEMAIWYGLHRSAAPPVIIPRPDNRAGPHVIHSPAGGSWAYLRAARFHARPGHADQLHLDLWWRGLNLAQDAGAYLYNASPPWDNALSRTAVHNTLSVDGLDQMRRAGRFLWLDWAQAQVETAERAGDGGWTRLAAFHDGYRRLGLRHRRQVTAFAEGGWEIQDDLLTLAGARLAGRVTARLHWLLPDWPWRMDTGSEEFAFWLDSPHGQVRITIRASAAPEISTVALREPLQPAAALPESTSTHLPPLQIQLVRAGELLAGEPFPKPGPPDPTWGWTSPTYGVKIPALSLSAYLHTVPPLTYTTTFFLPTPDP